MIIKNPKIQMPAEVWDNEIDYRLHLLGKLDEDTAKAIFDELLKGEKIVFVSELKTRKRLSTEMIVAERFVVLDEIVHCQECRYYAGTNCPCDEGLHANSSGFCYRGQKKEES